MRLAIGSDHAGFELKEILKDYLSSKNIEVKDCGPFNDERSDYPDYGKKVAQLVHDGEVEMAILVCGSGIGMCMTANRFSGVRAVVLRNKYDAEMSRKHNDANIACFGGRVSDESSAKELLDLFFATEFEGGRHEDRVKKIEL
jgi:ribose 5-phosphate isomerase B